MVDLTRRGVVLGAASLAAAGAGVTTAASGLEGSVEGQADVEAEQALVVNDINVVSGDQDAQFTRISDDNTEFQAAVELNNGDTIRYNVDVRNNAADSLNVQIQVDSPSVIDIAVGNDDTTDNDGEVDANTDDSEASNAAVKSGENTWIADIDSSSSSDSGENIQIAAELDDTASPGSYDIGVAINPLSANEDA